MLGKGLTRILNNSDVLVAFGLVCIVMMMIIPMPYHLLDMFLTFNISFSLVILLAAVFTLRPLEFSVLPSLLLIMTLFRLALNISSTRLILLDAFAGNVIQRFGDFVVRGDMVVGLVIFLILVVIQFIVITKGAERVSEVAARFTLDAMPGKQMGIDADLNTGLITEDEARERRREIQREADFYGAMDGASKFVKGDAIAAIVIIIINIVGGLIIGMVRMGMPFADAARTYTILTIGDGLVTQIPALLLSTATGMVVTRSASETNLGHELTQQLFNNYKVMGIAAVVLLGLGMAGMPKVPMFLMAALFGVLFYSLRRSAIRTESEESPPEEAEAEEIKRPENVVELLQVEKMELELGYGLIPLVDTDQGGDLLDRIVMIRRQCAVEMGFIVPPIRIRDNMQLKPNTYSIKSKGLEAASGELLLDSYLILGPGIEDDDEIKGVTTVEPAFKLPAKWISTAQREQAELKGYTVVDPPSVLATHLTQVIKEHAHELLGRQEVQNVINYIKEQNPAVVDELIPELLSIGEVQKVLSNLLQEQVPIRDMVTILETLADYAPITRDTDVLTEYARQALKLHITRQYVGEGQKLAVVTLDPELEDNLRDAVQQTEFGSYLALEPDTAQQLINQLRHYYEDLLQRGVTPVVLCAPVLRIYFKRLIERFIPEQVVLSYNEIDRGVEIEVVGMVAL
ncbi:MAG: flagellar biosynthesis protein FlhA [Syntrophothermaceae bacterium]